MPIIVKSIKWKLFETILSTPVKQKILYKVFDIKYPKRVILKNNVKELLSTVLYLK